MGNKAPNDLSIEFSSFAPSPTSLPPPRGWEGKPGPSEWMDRWMDGQSKGCSLAVPLSL